MIKKLTQPKRNRLFTDKNKSKAFRISCLRRQLEKQSSVSAIVIFAWLFVFVVIGIETECFGKTYVIITVDVESYPREKLDIFQSMDAKIGDVECGVSRMMDICDSYGVKATFFVNVYEDKKYGNGRMRELCRYIDGRRHDVQLHTHPDWAYDANRDAMHKYSLEEQIMIVKDGQNMLRNWLRKPAIAHRAGAYGADENTLEALRENGIFIDSSLFYLHSNCKLNALETPINKPFRIDGQIYEIPVTLYHLREYYRIASHDFNARSRFKKIDIDSSNLREIKPALDELAENGLQTVTLFLHSWTFIKKWDTQPAKREVDQEDITEFESIVSYLTSDERFQIVSTLELSDLLYQGQIDFNRQDVIPKVSRRISLVNYIRKILRINRTNFHLYLILFAGLFLSAVMIVIVIRKKRLIRNSSPAS